ncbi:hypothetical protein [Streptomyces sp. NPDC054863]
MDHRNENPADPDGFAARRAAQPPASKSRRPYAYNPDSSTATCRACHQGETNLTPQEAGPWHAGHQRACTGSPGGPGLVAQEGKILRFRR